MDGQCIWMTKKQTLLKMSSIKSSANYRSYNVIQDTPVKSGKLLNFITEKKTAKL